MKIRYLMLIVFILLFSQSYAQRIGRHALNKKVRDSIGKQLEIAIAYDQRYRWMCQFGTLEQREVDSFRKLDEASKFKRMSLAGGNKVGISKYQRDSLGKLQGQLDSVNFVKVTGILYSYGYPKNENDRTRLSVIIMHNDDRIDTAFLSMAKQEVFDRNLPAVDYAIWYDRFQSARHLPKLYYIASEFDEDGNTFAPERPKDMAATNKAREEIGLKKITQ